MLICIICKKPVIFNGKIFRDTVEGNLLSSLKLISIPEINNLMVN